MVRDHAGGGLFGVAVTLLYYVVPYGVARSVRVRGLDQETRHLAQALAVTMPAAVLSAGTFDAFGFPTWVGVMSVFVGAIGALWRMEGAGPSRPLQPGDPADRYVAPPVMASARGRIRDAWASSARPPRSTPRSVARDAPATPP